MKGTESSEVGLPGVIRAPRTDAIYNCHAYLTKIPVAAISPFIREFSNPGERVLDMFAGSGMTGLAAVTQGRVAVLSDISVLGQHIAQGYLTRVPTDDFLTAAKNVVAEAKAKLGDLYTTTRLTDGAMVEQVRTIWSFDYACPKCGHGLVYYDLITSDTNVQACSQCATPFSKRAWHRIGEQPVRVVVKDQQGRQVEQNVQAIDIERIESARHDPRQNDAPSLVIGTEREMFGRSGLGKSGIRETKEFFSPRNLIALFELWTAIQQNPHPSIRKKLLFCFTASLARASRRYQWGPKRPLNAQNQTYYIAPVFYEWNVFELYARKIEAARRADAILFDSHSLFLPELEAKATYELASAHDLRHVESTSIDYVFTDPPFGSNIFYADMNLFHEAWLGRSTDDASEAVMHTTGSRRKASAHRYETLLRGSFCEAFRVLKPGRYMSLVFGNSSGTIWDLVQRALRDSGFSAPVHIAILDKGQRSVKGLNSGTEGVVTVDLILTVRKPVTNAKLHETEPQRISIATMLKAVASTLSPDEASNPSYVYAATLREAINQGIPLENLHYSDVLTALTQFGVVVDSRKGLLSPSLADVAL